MSLRFAGSQLLQTLPSPLLAGASTASLSMWVRVNPGSAVADPAGVTLLGGGGRLAVGLSAAGDLRVNWSANAAGVDVASSWGQPLVAGVSYHLAATWQGGVQRYYVNGLLVYSDAQAGTLGRLGAPAPQPFRLGSALAGVDVTLDDPTLWVGYALTASDVRNLRDRAARPEAISPPAVALHWTLAGPAGSAAAPGDAGLADGSATGLPLSSVVGAAPSYAGGALTYALLDGGCSARVAPSGQGIFFLFRDAATNPISVDSLTSNDEQQSITLGGRPAGGQFSLTFKGQATAPIPAIPSPPAVYFRWNATLAAPGAVNLAVNLRPSDSLGTPAALYEVMDNGIVIGTATLNQATRAGNPATFTDGTLAASVGGGAVSWTTLGTFTFSSTAASVRLSCPNVPPSDPNYGTSYATNYLNADSLRVKPASGAAVVVGPSGAAKVATLGSIWQQGGSPESYQVTPGTGGRWFNQGLGAGIRYLASPPVVQSSLQALSSIGPGNLTAASSGNGDPATPIVLTFAGSLAGAAQSLITAADAAIHISRIYAGGLLPTFKVNGTAIATGGPGARRPYYGTGNYDSSGNPKSHLAYLATAYFPLIQAAPAQHFQPVLQQESTVDGLGIFAKGSWSLTAGSTGYTPLTYSSTSASAQATYVQAPLKAGTYRVSATWTAAAGQATRVVYAVKNRAGTALGSIAVDQTAAPDGTGGTYNGRPFQVVGSYTFGGLSDDLVVTQSRASGPAPMIADTVLFERTSADDSARIQPGDVVTYSAGAGWATALMVGGSKVPAPAATDAPVANLVGTPIYPASTPTTRTMGIGYNHGGFGYFQSLFAYYNAAHAIDTFSNAATNPDGYPVSSTQSSVTAEVAQSPPSIGADGKGWPSIQPGNYVVIWDGASNVTLNGTPNGTSLITRTTNNKRYFRLDADRTSYGVPYLACTVSASGPAVSGVYPYDVSNLRIFPILPGVSVDSPPKWHPAHLARLQGVDCLRYMDNISAIKGNSASWLDFNRPQGNLGRGAQPRQLSLAIARIEPYVGTFHWSAYTGPTMRITTAGPHGLVDGTWVTFDSSSSIGVMHVSDGLNEADVKDMYGHVLVLSATELYFAWRARTYDTTRPPVTALTTITNPAGRMLVSIGGGMPFADLVDLANAVDADVHINIPVTASDDALARMGSYLAANLNPGRKARVAWGNENWNVFLQPYTYACRQTFALFPTGAAYFEDYVPYAANQSQRAWSLVGAGFSSAGRAGDLIRLVEGQWGSTGVTGNLAAKFVALGQPFDEYAIAPYYDNQVSFPKDVRTEPTFNPLVDLFTADQLIDFYEMFITYGGWNAEVPAHRSVLDAAGLKAVKIIFYEAGPQFMIPPGSSARLCGRTHAVHRHPRFFGFMTYSLQMYQATGCTLYMDYYLSGTESTQFLGNSWSAYTGTVQSPYAPGDPTQDAIQVNQFERTDLIRSVTGGAISAWAAIPSSASALTIPPTTTTTPPPTTIAPPRRLASRGAGAGRVRPPFRP